jgi:hypothetical protein
MLFLSFTSNSWRVHVGVISLIGTDEGLTEKGRRDMYSLITEKSDAVLKTFRKGEKK